MKRYIRFGPPDIDSEQDSNPRKVSISNDNKKKPTPKSISEKAFSAKINEIKARVGIAPNPQMLISQISELKKFKLTPALQKVIEKLRKAIVDEYRY
jgi:hypothetical protein